jgi:hypothetical protein
MVSLKASSLLEFPKKFVGFVFYSILYALMALKNGVIQPSWLVYYRWLTFGLIMYWGKTIIYSLHHYTDYNNQVGQIAIQCLFYSFTFGWDFCVTRAFLVEKGFEIPKKAIGSFLSYIAKIYLVSGALEFASQKLFDISYLLNVIGSLQIGVWKIPFADKIAAVVPWVTTLPILIYLSVLILFWQFAMIDRNYPWLQLWKPFAISAQISHKAIFPLFLLVALSKELRERITFDGSFGVLFPIIITLVLKQSLVGLYKTYRKNNLSSYQIH